MNITTKDDEGTPISIPAKIVYVRNTKKKKDWVALISTNTDLSEEDIIRIYGKRWNIIPISALYSSGMSSKKEECTAYGHFLSDSRVLFPAMHKRSVAVLEK